MKGIEMHATSIVIIVLVAALLAVLIGWLIHNSRTIQGQVVDKSHSEPWLEIRTLAGDA